MLSLEVCMGISLGIVSSPGQTSVCIHKGAQLARSTVAWMLIFVALHQCVHQLKFLSQSHNHILMHILDIHGFPTSMPSLYYVTIAFPSRLGRCHVRLGNLGATRPSEYFSWGSHVTVYKFSEALSNN